MFSLKPFNTYGIESYAKYVYFPSSTDKFIEIYQRHNENVFVLGNGSNVILAKEHYIDTAFIIVRNNYSKIVEFDQGVYAQSGVLLKDLSLHAYHRGLSGLETFYDVPASVGGAMIMNTGAYGDQIYDNVSYVDTLDLKDLKEKRIPKSNIEYGYRYSSFKSQKCIILGAAFNLVPKTKSEIKSKMLSILAQRRQKLPIEPSAGSVFKRPNYSITVGEMVQNLGLKGYQIGGAQILKKHGGIIINTDHAAGKDILDLVSLLKEKVFENFAVKLSLEQIVLN